MEASRVGVAKSDLQGGAGRTCQLGGGAARGGPDPVASQDIWCGSPARRCWRSGALATVALAHVGGRAGRPPNKRPAFKAHVRCGAGEGATQEVDDALGGGLAVWLGLGCGHPRVSLRTQGPRRASWGACGRGSRATLAPPRPALRGRCVSWLLASARVGALSAAHERAAGCLPISQGPTRLTTAALTIL